MLVLLWTACDAGAYAPAAPATPSTDEPTYAVVRLAHTTIECSNLGGVHYSFAVDEPGVPRVLHSGDHGELNLDLADDTYYVAEVSWGNGPVPTDGDAGWCLDGLPPYSGEVLRFQPAHDLADARRQLAAIQRDGWPARIVDHTPMVVTMESTSSSCMNMWFVDFTFAIAESGVARMVHARSSQPEVAVPLTDKFRRSRQIVYFVADVSPAKSGDHLVGMCGDIPTYAGMIDRLVPATSLADAQRRLAAIKRDGWPATAYMF
jgi:hypothetical protein